MSAGLYVKLPNPLLLLSCFCTKESVNLVRFNNVSHKNDMQIIIVSLETHLTLQSAVLVANDPFFHNKRSTITTQLTPAG